MYSVCKPDISETSKSEPVYAHLAITSSEHTQQRIWKKLAHCRVLFEERISLGNRAYYANQDLFKIKPLTRNSKLQIYKTLVRPIITYACETWVLKENIKTKLRVFERNVLTHWGRVTQICVFNTRSFSLHNTLNYAIHRACLRMVLLMDVYWNLTSLWINL